MYSSITLGKYIILVCKQRDIFLNRTKLQKLMYVIYGAMLAAKGIRSIDEQPRAWPFGPVFPRAQNYFSNEDNFSNVASSDEDEFSQIKEDEALIKALEATLDAFGSWTARGLSMWSHEDGSPWDKALQKSKGTFNATIDDSEIKSYFKKIVRIDED